MAVNRELTQEEKTWEMDPIWDGFNLIMIDNQTGKTKLVHTDLTWYSSYICKEGNFSCDCNRGMFFFNDHDLDFPCSGKRFTIVKAVFPDGTEELID